MKITAKTIDFIGNNKKLNLLIDSLEQADIKALLQGNTITVFRKFQLKRIEEYCSSINFHIRVQPCYDPTTDEVWAYNISKYYPQKRTDPCYGGGRYHY